MNWIISANSKMYDHSSSFEHYGFIDWRQGNAKFEIGDTVYIYCTSPVKMLQYKCSVERINLTSNEIRDDKEYWINEDEYHKSLGGKFMSLRLVEQVSNDQMRYEVLLKNGLNGAPQGPIKIKSEILLNHIETYFTDNYQVEFFPEVVNDKAAEYEGAKRQITVNKYERSSKARENAIEHHGLNCKVCNLNFLNMYGEIGKGFIHVHHLIPIHEIGKEYKIDYKKDLIPVCPNCHAMLHRKIDNKEPTVEDLRNMLNK